MLINKEIFIPYYNYHMKKLQQVKKIIIPAAGWGTRFLPLTKVVDKELVPILNKPALDHLVHECIDAGIEEVIIITTKRKQAIQKYFNVNHELEESLLKNNKQAIYKEVLKTNMPCKITYIFQDKQLSKNLWISSIFNKTWTTNQSLKNL